MMNATVAVADHDACIIARDHAAVEGYLVSFVAYSRLDRPK